MIWAEAVLVHISLLDLCTNTREDKRFSERTHPVVKDSASVYLLNKLYLMKRVKNANFMNSFFLTFYTDLLLSLHYDLSTFKYYRDVCITVESSPENRQAVFSAFEV